jgi:NADH dehydrogenase
VILVAGGTGRLGSRVVHDLVASGHEVRVLARGRRRRPPDVFGAEVVSGSVTDPAAVARAVRGAEVVVHAVTGFPVHAPERVDLAGTKALLDAAERAGAFIVLLSVAGAAADSPLGLFRAKHASEQLLHRHTVPFTVVRPEAFADLWIEILRRSAKRSHRPVVLGRGTSRRGWVAVRDVSALTVRAVESPALRGSTLTLTGPEQLSATELARRLMAAEGWPGEPRHVPVGVLAVAARLPGRAGRLPQAALAMESMSATPDDARRAVPGLPSTSVDELLERHLAGSA